MLFLDDCTLFMVSFVIAHCSSIMLSILFPRSGLQLRAVPQIRGLANFRIGAYAWRRSGDRSSRHAMNASINNNAIHTVRCIQLRRHDVVCKTLQALAQRLGRSVPSTSFSPSWHSRPSTRIQQAFSELAARTATVCAKPRCVSSEALPEPERVHLQMSAIELRYRCVRRTPVLPRGGVTATWVPYQRMTSASTSSRHIQSCDQDMKGTQHDRRGT